MDQRISMNTLALSPPDVAMPAHLTLAANAAKPLKGETTMATPEIDIRLERDPRYAAAKTRLTELQLEVMTLEAKRQSLEAELAGSAEAGAASRIAAEAQALLAGASAEKAMQGDLRVLLGKTAHSLAVVRRAVEMQHGIVKDLASEVGSAIARDMLPQHKANVAAVVAAALDLNTALEAEAELREALYENGVMYTGHIRPMPISGFGRIADTQSRISQYLAEAIEYGFVSASSMPDIVRDRVPKPQKKAEAPVPARRNVDGWVNA